MSNEPFDFLPDCSYPSREWDWTHDDNDYAPEEDYWMCDDCADSPWGMKVVMDIEALIGEIKIDLTTCCACLTPRP